MRDEFQRELNGLFWIEEAERSGAQDFGWSCREHAWATALLARSSGIPAFVMNGKLSYVIHLESGRGILDQHFHSWVAVEGQGFFDFSPKPVARVGQLNVPISKVAFLQPLDKGWGNIQAARNEVDFVERREAGKGSVRSLALYWGLECDRPMAEMIEGAADYINSPLTDLLKSRFDSSIYANALLHLHGVLHRRRAPLAVQALMDRWEVVARAFDRPVHRAINIAGI